MNGITGHMHSGTGVELTTLRCLSFELPPVDMRLMDDEIHLWFGELAQTETELHGFMKTLSKEERAKAEQYHFQKDRNWYIARHGMLRMILGSYLGEKASNVRFKQGIHGKPEIDDPSCRNTIRFNLSHANGAVLMAFARHGEIGVDLEQNQDIPEMEQIVERFFSAEEKGEYHSSPQEMKRDAFFTCWTRKEALVKATGEGLSFSLDTYEESPSVAGEGGAAPMRGEVMEKRLGWSIHTLRPSREFVGALASASKRISIRCFTWMGAGAN